MTIPILYHINPLSFRPRIGYGCVYRYTVSGRNYIGQTRQNVISRHRAHIAYYPSFKELNVKLPVDHYLRDNPYTLTILWTGKIEHLNDMESELIRRFDTIAPHGWNYTAGGDTPTVVSESTREKLRNIRLGKPCSDATKQKLREYNLAHPSRGTLGKPVSDATREKLRLANLGKKHTAESRFKISQSLKGKKRSSDAVYNMTVAQRKRFENPEERAKAISQLEHAWAHNKGRALTEEHKKKQSESLKNNKSRKFRESQFQKRIVLKLDISNHIIDIFPSTRSVDMPTATWHRVQTEYYGFYRGFRYCYADEHSI